MKTKTLQLTLTVTYNQGKESVQTLNNLLHSLVRHGVDNGKLTGETTATVEEYEAQVVEVKPPPTTTGHSLWSHNPKSKRKKMVRQHVMSTAPVPRCLYCGADEDDAFVGGEECVLREAD
jgi:hypothetical protein